MVWLPVVTERLEPGLPWDDTRVARVNGVADVWSTRPLEDKWLVSYSMSLLDFEVRSSALRLVLGFDRPPPVVNVATQLTAIASADRATRSSAKSALPIVVPQIYQLLNASVDTPEFEVVEDGR